MKKFMAIPTYRWSQQVSATDSGNIVQISIQQEDVPLDFCMPIPVTVEYDDGEKVWQCVWVERNSGQCTFSLRAAQVKKVEFNASNTV